MKNTYYTHYPSLLIVLNGAEVRWFRVDEHTMTQIDQDVFPVDTYSDHEGFYKQRFFHSDSIKAGEGDNLSHVERERLRHFFGGIAETTKFIVNNHMYYHVSCIAPGRYHTMLCDYLYSALPNTVIHMLRGNFVHATPDQLHRLFVASLKPHAIS